MILSVPPDSFLSLPFPQHWLPTDTCLVGGTVRDVLLNRQRKGFDFDLVLNDGAIEFARDIAKRCEAGFVVLDQERDIARVVFAEGTVDFAKIEGATLEQDLRRRDFTINSIAYHLDSQTFIDPLGGRQDLEIKTIRMVSQDNLKDDPLRLLRGYRQAAQLNFTIDRFTRHTIAELAPHLKTVAAERIKSELSYLLDLSRGSSFLQQAYKDGVLSSWFPSLTPQQVQAMMNIETAKQQLRQQWSTLQPLWETNVGGQSDSLQSLAKLACLVSPHPTIAETELTQLKYSRAEVRTITTTLRLLPQLLSQKSEPMSWRDQYFFFQDAVKVFPCLLLIAVAKGLSLDSVSPLVDRFLNPKDSIAYPQPLVTGNDLIRSLSLSPSPLVGELLTELQIAQIEGKINSREEAIHLAESLTKNDSATLE